MFSLSMLFVFPHFVFSASLSSVNDVLTRIEKSQATDHTVTFMLGGSTVFDAGETITLTFPGSSFSLAGLSAADPVDYDVKVGATDETIVAASGCGVFDAIEITSVSATVITFTACGSYTSGAAGAVVEIQIGTNATLGGTGNSQIVNPGTANSYSINLAAAGDTGVFAIGIINDDLINIVATVDPILDVVISANNCDLGTLSLTAVRFCSYSVTVGTNAAGGYVGTIKEDQDLQNAALNTISDAGGDNDVDLGSEEYGVGTSKAGQTITQFTTCANNNPQPAKALTTSAQQFANSAGAISGDATTLCHVASINAATEAGVYSQTVTVIVTATF